MHLSKGEYSQFSLKGRLKLVQQFGVFIQQKYVDNIKIEIYMLYGFYVEVLYSNEKAFDALPIKHAGLMNYYL
jgi:hypothetical protein